MEIFLIIFLVLALGIPSLAVLAGGLALMANGINAITKSINKYN